MSQARLVSIGLFLPELVGFCVFCPTARVLPMGQNTGPGPGSPPRRPAAGPAPLAVVGPAGRHLAQGLLEAAAQKPAGLGDAFKGCGSARRELGDATWV